MTVSKITLNNVALEARPAGTLWWPGQRTLCVSDLHLGKSERVARRSGALLPPYETTDTLARLASEIDTLSPARVICLGDSFDDDECINTLGQAEANRLSAMMKERNWIWISGNHDAGKLSPGAQNLDELHEGPLVFRHIAKQDASGEISGHYHPKATLPVRLQRITRSCFLADARRIILPAFGTYTGGLQSHAEVLQRLMARDSIAILTGKRTIPIPMPRKTSACL